jgi:hypothetical protein
MRWFLLWIGLTGAVGAQAGAPAGDVVAARGPDIAVLDATPEFFRFWSAAAGKPEPERVRLFLDTVVAAHPELFTPDVLGKAGVSGGSGDTDPQAIVAAYLRDVAPFVARMQVIAGTIHRDLNDSARAFTKTFPDYAAATPVYFTVSMFSFDGGTRMVRDRIALLFGIDGIARYHGPDDNPRVLIDHELFHQYHAQIAPELAAEDVPLWVSLWEEGLATYVSEQMNPGTSDAQVLMSPTLAAQVAPILPVVTAELLANFESKDKAEYAAFFYGRNGRSDIPARCGYYVGLLVARRLAAGRSPQQLAALRGPALEAAVRGALEQLARVP